MKTKRIFDAKFFCCAIGLQVTFCRYLYRNRLCEYSVPLSGCIAGNLQSALFVGICGHYNELLCTLEVYYPVSFQGFTADRHDGADGIQKIFDCILYCVSGNLCRNAGFNIGDVLRTGRNRTVSGVGCAAVYSVWNSAVFFVPNVLCSSSDRKKCTYDCGNCCDSGRGRNVYGSVL